MGGRRYGADMTGQAEITAEIAAIHTDYHRAGVEESQPRLNHPPYRSSMFRHPTYELHRADPEAIELSLDELERRGPGLVADYHHPGGGQFISWVE